MFNYRKNSKKWMVLLQTNSSRTIFSKSFNFNNMNAFARCLLIRKRQKVTLNNFYSLCFNSINHALNEKRERF